MYLNYDIKRNRKKILDVSVDFDLTIADVLDIADDIISKKETTLLSTTNPYFIMAAQKDDVFRDIINKSALSVPDGIGVLYANYYMKCIEKLPVNMKNSITSFFLGLYVGLYGTFKPSLLGKTITGVELTYKLCQLAADKGYSVFLLGGRQRDALGHDKESTNDIAILAADNLIKKYPKLNIVGSTSQFSKHSHDDNPTLDFIHRRMEEKGLDHIDILLVAYNPIDQEKWISRDAHKIPATLCMGVGRTFDYISGYMNKPPDIFEKIHMTWLYTFFTQPWRIKRIFMTFPLFPIYVFKKSLID